MEIASANTIYDARKKFAAANELLGMGKFEVYATGVWRMPDNDLLFFDISKQLVIKLGTKYAYFRLEDGMVKARPDDADAEIIFTI